MNTPAPSETASPAGDGAAFRDWGARRRATQSEAAANSRRVRRLRLALPAMAILVLVGFVGLATLRSVDQSFLLRFTGLSREGEGLKMVNPSFSGLDSDGRAFLVTADAAEQDEVRDDKIALVRPLAQAAIDTPEQATVTSKTGVFFNDEKLLNLNGDVVMLYGGDYVFRTEKASLSFEDKRMYGDAPVEGEGPLGQVRANAFEAFEDGGRLLFRGDVRMRVTPSKDEGGLRPSLTP
ncbi:MAG: LPS export ABC transporter periplasmic protein LptC [Pseudomonadota bacterium]